MKKILILAVCVVGATTTHAQNITLKMLLSGQQGQIVMFPGFVTHIKPLLPTTMNIEAKNNYSIAPKIHTLPDSMTVENVIVTYLIKSIDISDPGLLVQNYFKGNFDKAVLSKEAPLVLFVTNNADNYKPYIVQLAYVPELQKWALEAHDMDTNLKSILKKGAKVVSY